MNGLVKWYGILNKVASSLINEFIQSDLLKEKRKFQMLYNEYPTQEEEIEIKKALIMKKAGVLFVSIFIITVMTLSL